MESDVHVHTHTHTHADTVREVRAHETSHSEVGTVHGPHKHGIHEGGQTSGQDVRTEGLLGAGHAYISTKSCVTGQTHADTTRQQ